MRQRAGELVEFQHGGSRCGVRARAAVEVGERAEPFVRGELLHRLRQRRLAQLVRGGVVREREIGRQIELCKPRFQQLHAERVHRTDGRAPEQDALTAQKRAVRLLREPVRKARGDAPAQLFGGGARESDDQKPIGRDGMVFPRDEADGALGENGRLAAARGGADEQRSAVVLNGSLLLRRPLHTSSPPFGSNTLSGASTERSPQPSSWRHTAR